jgi:hypothetical protein
MRGCGFVDDAPAAHRGACGGQLCELTTAHPFAHKLHSHLPRLKQRSQNPEITSPNYNQSAQHRPRSRSPECPVTMPESAVTFAGIRTYKPSGQAFHVAVLNPRRPCRLDLDRLPLRKRA